MVMFQRARSEQQRELRRRAILDAAAAMLAEMPVAEVTLNELSRRVGLAKSNVLRYFESREAVLLELLDLAAQEWLAQLEQDLAGAIRPGGPAAGRADQLAAVIAASLAARPVLCDLAGAQSAVLERNVSAQVAAEYKRATITNVGTLGRLVLGCLPELGARRGRPVRRRYRAGRGRAMAGHPAIRGHAGRLCRRPGPGRAAARLRPDPAGAAGHPGRRGAGPGAARGPVTPGSRPGPHSWLASRAPRTVVAISPAAKTRLAHSAPPRSCGGRPGHSNGLPQPAVSPISAAIM